MGHGSGSDRGIFGAAKTRAIGDRSDIDRVKDSTDLVRLIGEHIALRPKGREYVGLCPFHDDHAPSMCVVPEKQFYKCFSCGAAGDCFGFVQNFLKMEFREALEFLADRAGVTLTPLRRSQDAGGLGETDGAPTLNKQSLYAASAMANEFFQAILKHADHGVAAREVIKQRQVTPEIAQQFQLGASPDRWDGLLLTASKQGTVSVDALLGAGLLKARDNSSGFYDAFRNRLMFPIHDRSGRVIAFGARKINPEDEPKYLNSPETRLFNKSATLYALHHALRDIQLTRTAIICEGYMDVIACHQAGFKNAVATLGTALTRDHAKQLRLACDKIVLLFDGDEAGQRATDRAAEIFFAEPIDVAVVTLNRHTEAKDPDELLKREDGAEVFKHALDNATELLAYRFERIRARLANVGPAALSKAMTEELEKLVSLGLPSVEPVRQALIVRQLASIAGISEQSIRAAIPRGRDARRTLASQSAVEEPNDDQLEARRLRTMQLAHIECILGCLLCDGHLWRTLSEKDKDLIAPHTYRFAVVQRVAQAVHDVGEDGHAPALQAVLSQLAEDEPAREAAISLMSRMDEQSERSLDRLHAFWHWSFAQARRDALLRQPHASTELEPKPADTESLQARATTIANLHRTLGPDRRRVPRPSS